MGVKLKILQSTLLTNNVFRFCWASLTPQHPLCQMYFQLRAMGWTAPSKSSIKCIRSFWERMWPWTSRTNSWVGCHHINALHVVDFSGLMIAQQEKCEWSVGVLVICIRKWCKWMKINEHSNNTKVCYMEVKTVFKAFKRKEKDSLRLWMATWWMLPFRLDIRSISVTQFCQRQGLGKMPWVYLERGMSMQSWQQQLMQPPEVLMTSAVSTMLRYVSERLTNT